MQTDKLLYVTIFNFNLLRYDDDGEGDMSTKARAHDFEKNVINVTLRKEKHQKCMNYDVNFIRWLFSYITG